MYEITTKEIELQSQTFHSPINAVRDVPVLDTTVVLESVSYESGVCTMEKALVPQMDQDSKTNKQNPRIFY